MRSLATVAILAAAFLFGARAIYEPDLWYHLAQGRELAAGHLIRSNFFSFTFPDYPQPYVSWLFDLTAYLAWSAGGSAGIQVLHIALLAAAFTVLYAAARTLAGTVSSAAAASGAAVAVLGLGLFVIEPRAIPRPHLVSFVGLAAVSWLIARAIAARRARPLVWSVPLIVVWSNFHVESLFGAAFLGLFAAAELVQPAALPRAEARRALGIAIVCAIATLATPYGWGGVRYLFENAGVPSLLQVAELQPPYLPAYRAFFVYCGVWVVLLLSQPRQLRLWEIVTGVVFAALGFRYLRLTPLVVFVTAPMLAARVALFIANGLDRRAVAVTALAAAAVVARIPVPTLFTTWRIGGDAAAPAAFFSARAIQFARTEGLSGPLFNSNNLGGFLAWSLPPPARIFQDSRLQAYPRAHFEAILRASRSQSEWDQLVAPVDWAMVSLARPVELSGAGRFPRPDWAIVFWDEAVEVLVRRSGAHAGLAAARDYTLLTPDANALVLAADLKTERRGRLLLEAERNRLDDPDAFTATAIRCLSGEDAPACADLDRLGAERPSLAEAVRQVQAMRAKLP